MPGSILHGNVAEDYRPHRLSNAALDNDRMFAAENGGDEREEGDSEDTDPPMVMRQWKGHRSLSHKSGKKASLGCYFDP